MTKFTQALVNQHNARLEKSSTPKINEISGAPESKLHDDIITYCKGKGWYVVHSRMDKPTTCGIGSPDFIIACDHGQTLWIECKGKGKKPTIEQLGVKLWLTTRGHIAHVVWSMDDFLTAVKRLK